ncbi:hypothetical protein HA402_002150 [Bradysia odoriphaga]|nr:hypothetical protein HA402_002150 [Bradysia odoriphaga]
MKAIAGILFVFVTVDISFPTTTAQLNIEAVQIVKPTKTHSLQYVKDNKLEEILNSDEIKDRYVAVVSIVGLVQSGKSFLLNLFLNYLRETYQIFNPFTNETYESDWMNMNVTNGFNTTQNRNGTTKGIWAWPEIFIHDNITFGTESGNKVAIILLDTEGLFHIDTDLRHNTIIFALSTMFSSMQGYNVFKDVNSDTMQFLDIFSTYTVYGSSLMATQSTQSTVNPFQDFYFIVRDSDHLDESENVMLNRIFPDDDNDQNREMKARIKSVFKKIRAFQMPHLGGNVSMATFNGDAALIDQRFKDKVATVVTDVLAPESIVIKEINGERVKAKDLAHFLKSFTDIVENNVTIATTLVEVLANASNWMVYENYVEYYDDLMRRNFNSIANTSRPYFQNDVLHQIHLENKNTSMCQFKNRIKLGGEKLASPFEKMLNNTIDEHFINFRDTNDKMRLEFLRERDTTLSKLDGKQLWILVSLVVAVAFFAGVQTLRKKPEYFSRCRKAQTPNQMKAVSESTTKA